jgi:hypothetical protein
MKLKNNTRIIVINGVNKGKLGNIIQGTAVSNRYVVILDDIYGYFDFSINDIKPYKRIIKR